MEATLHRIVGLSKEFDLLYGTTGMIDVSFCKRVQIRKDMLFEIPGELQEKRRDCSTYPYEGYKHYAGIKFFAISEKSFLEATELDALEVEEAKILEAEMAEVTG